MMLLPNELSARALGLNLRTNASTCCCLPRGGLRLRQRLIQARTTISELGFVVSALDEAARMAYENVAVKKD